MAKVEVYQMEDEWKMKIEDTLIVCQKYGVVGKWVCEAGTEKVKLLFQYHGRNVEEEFTTQFNEERMQILSDTAVMMMEAKIEAIIIEEMAGGGTLWN